jgi:hypothetical protein
MATDVFVSYRRKTDGYHAYRIRDRLDSAPGIGDVFLDDESLRGGQRWREEIRTAIRDSDVLVALIGRSWIRSRIDEDYLAREIAFARRNRVPILPVVVDRARLPTIRHTPKMLQPVLDLEALWLPGRGGRAYVAALDRIVDEVHELADTPCIVRVKRLRPPILPRGIYLDATVFIDGAPVGAIADTSSADFPVKPGQHTIHVRVQGQVFHHTSEVISFEGARGVTERFVCEVVAQPVPLEIKLWRA